MSDNLCSGPASPSVFPCCFLTAGGGAELLANARGLVFSLRRIKVFVLDLTVALFTGNYSRCPPQELQSNRSCVALGRDGDTRCIIKVTACLPVERAHGRIHPLRWRACACMLVCSLRQTPVTQTPISPAKRPQRSCLKVSS